MSHNCVEEEMEGLESTSLAWRRPNLPAVEAAIGIIHIILLYDAGWRCCCCYCSSCARILRTGPDITQQQSRAQDTHEFVHFIAMKTDWGFILCCSVFRARKRGKSIPASECNNCCLLSCRLAFIYHLVDEGEHLIRTRTHRASFGCHIQRLRWAH